MSFNDDDDFMDDDADFDVDSDGDVQIEDSQNPDDEDPFDTQNQDMFEEEEDSNFLPVVSEREMRKEYDVDFVIFSPKEILSFQESEISQVSAILGCPPQTAATLLRHFHWHKERLIESYMDDSDRVAAAAGVIMDASKQPRPIAVPGFMCDICCNDEDGLMSLALSCGHRFCVDCYSHYVAMKIKEEGESRSISCAASGCKIIVDEMTVKSLVDESTHEKYRELLMRTYVDDSPYLKWCPAPNCDYAVECKVRPDQLKEIVPTVTCRCGFNFCFGCSLLNHQPSPCFLVKLWIKKCADDSETANWISANTKECIKCQTSIEKNGGCNHMTCRKCKHEFCWVCLGPWSEHGTSWYSCNRFEEKSGIDARDSQARSRAALERYLHYFNRYDNHDKSAKLDKDLYEKTEKKMEEMQQSSELSWIEVQFLSKAVEVLLQSRMTLKWTYCFAYYLVRNNNTQLFEDNQSDLEMAVEALSGLLEQPIDPSTVSKTKQLVLDKTVYVASRREILLKDTCRGLIEGRWEFTV
ncbi:hypothetical protein HK105_206223 [Polyrhizophydium stewartii]|uniref:RBR-type E3 ubiquitin transferase n=1 Tax=Polyrhizophydium stewartii TaxID=2732419 RepID=A0ABR4N426_9FUNG|nr:hypothetical protein HK105_007197 [Polyrhizophydium stewartii]